MAKMFYTFEEAQARTGKSPQELQAMVDDGTLRVFRDGAKIMFKLEDVDKLAADDSSGEIMELTAVDAKSESDTFTLDTVAETHAADAAAPETALSSAGIIEFDVDDLDFGEVADPSSKTQIAPSISEEIVLEGSGSGSGLLELTKESDDTSLGAELLDEIYPGDEAPTAVEGLTTVAPASDVPVEQAMYVQTGAVAAAATVVEAEDPAEMAFGVILAVGCVVMLFMGVTIGGMITGTVPQAVTWLNENLLICVVAALILVVVLAVVGFVLASAARSRQAVAQRYY